MYILKEVDAELKAKKGEALKGPVEVAQLRPYLWRLQHILLIAGNPLCKYERLEMESEDTFWKLPRLFPPQKKKRKIRHKRKIRQAKEDPKK